MRDIICIGGSAGSIDALRKIVADLPAGLPASVFVVVHIPPFATSNLAPILDRGALRAAVPLDHEPFAPGRIYVAPPDHHLLMERGEIRVLKGPKENRSRPAIDPLFRSAAQFHPTRSIGVILSGTLDDGTAGLWALKRSGGLAVMQDLQDAQFPDMPRNASKYVTMDRIAKASEMGHLLAGLSAEIPRGQADPAVTHLTEIENAYAKLEDVPRSKMDAIGIPASLICPSCHGPMWKIKEGPARFRCHTGHSFTPATMLFEHREVTERTLGVLMTLFDDEVTLTQEVLKTASNPEMTRELKENLRRSEERAADLRKLLPGGYRSK